MKIIIFFLILIFSSLTSNHAYAADPVLITPTSNIVGGIVGRKEFDIRLDYQSAFIFDEDSTVELYEDEVLVNTQNTIDGNILNINYDELYLPQKTYRLEVSNIDSPDPDISFADINISFKYSSLTTFVFGTSVKGRDLIGYTLGEGSQVFMLIGGIHGNEQNTTRLVSQLLTHYKLNQQWIPNDTKIVFVPNLNPDGYAKGSRMNARSVDLNRNANTRDWQARTYIGYLSYRYGGGRYPNSEPETRAIVNLIKRHNPFLTISYHSAGGFVITNGRPSRNLAKLYANMSRYKYVDQSSGGVAFIYKITGDLTTWMYEKGFKTLTVELKSREYSEISPNLRAVQKVINSN
jgi:hypothetical protein